MGKNRFIGSRNHLFSLNDVVCVAAQAIGHTTPLALKVQNNHGGQKRKNSMDVDFRLFETREENISRSRFLLVWFLQGYQVSR